MRIQRAAMLIVVFGVSVGFAASVPPMRDGVIAGDFVYVANVVGRNVDQSFVPDVATQTRQALQALRAELQTHGITLSDVVSVNVFLSDTRHFSEMNRVYRGFFDRDPPTRATVEADLPDPGALIQISAVATRRGDRQVISPAALRSPELPYSWGIKTGNTLFIAGATSRDPDTYQPVQGGIGAQTRRVMQNVGLVLEAADMDYGDVVSCKVFLDDPRSFADMNREYRTFFAADDPPARATVRAGLMNPVFLVEIQCLAERTEDRRVVRAAGAARSNAPFSPAIRTGDRIHLAGMVGRGPDGYGDVRDQTRVTLENLRSTLIAADVDFTDVIEAIVFVTDIRNRDAVMEVYGETMPSPGPPATVVGTPLMSAAAQVEIMMTAERR